MNLINTSNIIEPSQLQPFTGYSLAFLQNSTKEMLYSIVQMSIGNTPSTTTPYVMWGCVKTNIGGSNYSYSQGYIMYNQEIYYFPAISSISITDTDVVTITLTPDAIADPLYFTNGSPFNVHTHRTLTLTNGLSGSGTFNYSSCVFLQPKPKINLKASHPNSVGFYGGTDNPITGITLTTPNDGITRNYYIVYNGTYTNNTINTPVGMGFRLKNVTTNTTLDYVHVGYASNAFDSYECGVMLQDYVSVGPNETIIVACTPNGNNGDASYNKLIMLEQ